MANQMIALQARNPQLPDPSRAAAQYANMMNMASQQRASQLQGERIRQEMEYARAGEARAAQTQTADMRDKDADFQDKELKRLGRIGVTVLRTEDPALREAAYQNLLSEVEKADPRLGATMRQVAPNFNAAVVESAVMEVDKYFNAKYPNAQATLEYTAKGQKDEQGNLIPEDTPVQVTTGINPSTMVIRSTPNAAPRTAPTAPQAAPPSGPIPTGKFGETRVIRPESVPLTPDQQDHIRRMQEELGMTNTPASFAPGASAGQMTPQRAQQIVDAAVNTRVMAQEDFDELLALTPEQNKQPFMDMIRSNGITLQPGGAGLQSQFAVNQGQRPQADFAVNRGATPMEQTLAQYIAIKRRDPNVSPLPGSSQVPLSRVAGEAEARRETPAQITARKNAELAATEAFEETNKDARLSRKREEVFEGERAKKDAAFVDSYSDAVTKGRTTLNVIDQMIGDARLEKGKLVVPKGGRRPHPGFEGVVGMGVPGVRFIPGTQAASFDALFRQAEGGAFLQAYESLRGTGQITEIEGTKATSALTRMERSQSEAEFVKAAREFADVIRGAVDRADKRYTTLTGKAPIAAPTQRKTPTKSSGGWGKAKVVGN
jgi:hypothetical protein